MRAAGRDPSLVRLRRGTVVRIVAARPGAVELLVAVEGRDEAAIAYPGLIGPLVAGDAVLLNTTAVDLGLGTGGLHLVVGVEGGPSTDLDHAGRVMKARYTPLQVAVQTVEETHRDAIEGARGLRNAPVVCAPLHSMIAPIAAGAKASADARVAYVMTDGAALAGSFSRLVPSLLEAGLLDGWITAGQAFGGGLEAVTIWTGLLAARVVLDAEVVVVADGPGNLGTDTTWGVSALGSGHALMAARTLGARPVAALRVSFADRRERHRGLSHHSVTILRDVCTTDVNVAVPTLQEPERATVWDALRAARLEERHQLVEADGRPALDELRRRSVEVQSMGRSPEDDPAFFLAAGAAGVLAGRMAAGSRRYRDLNR
ncbi:MAG TPA: DUF3866 family protein [Actinomycetota bacterium]|nr:DUF3866 family protein [Actinomycetota bacterium]